MYCNTCTSQFPLSLYSKLLLRTFIECVLQTSENIERLVCYDSHSDVRVHTCVINCLDSTTEHGIIINTARQYIAYSIVYCTYIDRYASALDTWAVFRTSRMRDLHMSQNEHFTYTYDIAVCIWIQYIRYHLSAYVL